MTVATLAVIGSVTGTKRGIKTLLLGQAYRDTLLALADEFADGLPMPDLRGVDRAEKKTLGELPRAELLAVQTHKLGDSAWSPSREHIIAIRFYVGGDDEELITDQVERYVLAARRLFETTPGDEARLFPFIAGTVDCGGEDYDPIVEKTTAERTLVKVGTLEVIVRTTT